MYYLAYNPSLGNALVGVTDSTLNQIEGLVILCEAGDMPDMSRFAWNTATLSWYPLYKQILSKREFLKRFTSTEYSTIREVCKANADVDYYWQLFTLSDEVDMSDTDTINGLQLLEAAGLLAAGRANEIIGL